MWSTGELTGSSVQITVCLRDEEQFKTDYGPLIKENYSQVLEEVKRKVNVPQLYISRLYLSVITRQWRTNTGIVNTTPYFLRLSDYSSEVWIYTLQSSLGFTGICSELTLG